MLGIDAVPDLVASPVDVQRIDTGTLEAPGDLQAFLHGAPALDVVVGRELEDDGEIRSDRALVAPISSMVNRSLPSRSPPYSSVRLFQSAV